jgi:hypothetical protein
MILRAEDLLENITLATHWFGDIVRFNNIQLTQPLEKTPSKQAVFQLREIYKYLLDSSDFKREQEEAFFCLGVGKYSSVTPPCAVRQVDRLMALVRPGHG